MAQGPKRVAVNDTTRDCGFDSHSRKSALLSAVNWIQGKVKKKINKLLLFTVI